MKKRLIRVVLLALLVVSVVLIHKRVQYEAQEAGRILEGPQSEGLIDDDVEGLSVLRAGDGVTLGRIEENTELGGVNIITTAADGTEMIHTFTDVDKDSWYANAVNYVVSAGLMNGSSEKPAFMPDYAIPREFFATLLYRFTKNDGAGFRSNFEDVSEFSWYYDAVSWATDKGIMMPASENIFGTGAYMTCEQAIICLYRLAGEPETDGSLTDYPYAAKVSEYGRNAMDWAWKNGLITEDECVWYPPQAISRAQTALLLMRFSEKNS